MGRCRCRDPAAAATCRRCHLLPPLPTPLLPSHPYSQLALAVGSELLKKKRAASQAVKKDISKGAAPLKASPAPSSSRQGNKTFRQAWRKTAGDLSEEEQRTAVLQVCPPGLQGGDDSTCCRVPCCVLWACRRCLVCRCPWGVTCTAHIHRLLHSALVSDPQALEVFRQLPPASSYAQHRIRVLEKALALLDKAGR